MKQHPLQLRDVGMDFPNGAPMLRQVSLSLAYGAYALTGINGAGKSTFLTMCAGIVAPVQGDILIAGHSLKTQTPQAKSKLGFMPDQPCVYPFLTGESYLQLIASCKGLSRLDDIKALLHHLNLADKLQLRFQAMSLGMQRKFMLVASLMGDPEVILLDEPINGLDSAAVAYLSTLVRQLAGRKVILASSHEPWFIEDIKATVLQLENQTILPTN
jgi:ABC-2 type transport system ATP-binding protein